MRKNLSLYALRAVLMVLLIACGVGNAWGFSSSPKFYAKKTSDTPAGAGKVYGYRGGGDGRSPYDVINLSINESDWMSPDGDNGATVVSDVTVKQDDDNVNGSSHPDGYKKMDRRQNKDGEHSIYILHMYFFAKPNPGYEFIGWYSDEAGTTQISGSTAHYPLPGVSGNSSYDPNKYYYSSTVARPGDDKEQEYNSVTWNNGQKGKTPAASGPWNDGEFYYLRHVHEIAKADGDKSQTVYVKFGVKPRAVVLGGTGFTDVTYTATGVSGSVGKDNQTLSNAKTDIAVSISYDADKYTFEGWKYSQGATGTKIDLSTETSCTYTLTNSSYVSLGLTEATKIHIWPIVKRKIVPVAEVTYNEETTPYESWAEAYAAATATGVSGAIITLYKNIDGISAVQAIDRDMTLDLNGFTFTGTANNLFTVSGTGTDFTICDGSPAKAGRVSFSTDAEQYSYAVTVESGAKLILQSGTIYADNTASNGSSRGVQIKSGATLEMTGGNVEAQSLQSAYAVINRGTATISSGDLYAHTTSAATAVAYLNTDNGTTSSISGGSFRAYAKTTTAYGIQQNVNNTITISNATVRAEAVTSTAYALMRNSQGVIVVNSGKFNAVAPSTVAAVNVTDKTQITLQGGIYRTNTNVGNCCASGYGCYELKRGEDWDAGYRYEVLPTSQARNFRVVANGESSYFTSFADLNTFINESSSPSFQIYLLVSQYTVPAGNYTIPSVATFLVPYDFACTIKTTDPEHEYAAPGTPSVYRKLILASGAHITNYGEISVSSTSQGGQPYGGCVYGKYGQIDMQSGSTITLKNGSKLYCWGYITGAGEITAESGSTVYEDFQIACWRGGSAASSMNGNSEGVFPLAQYYIQNIEAKLHLQAGAVEKVWTAVSALSDAQRPSEAIDLVGSSAGLFRITSGTLTKWFNTETDRQMYELEGNMSLASISMHVYITINSASYVLPLTNNMDIRIKSGTMSCDQRIAVLPGAKITIDEGANVSMGANSEVYVYDKDEWPNDGASAFNYNQVSFKKVNYTPSTITTPRTYTNMNDAIMDINGTFTTASGHFYTTQSKAQIISSTGTGRVVFTKAAQTKSATYQATQSGTDISYTSIPITSAQLKNADDTYTATAGAAANDQFVYNQALGKWMKNPKTVTWDATTNGGTTDATTTIVGDGSALSTVIASMPEASKAHNTFSGWFTASTGGTAVTTATTVSANVTYYAQFTPDQYNIIYKDKDNADFSGTHGTGYPTKHTYGTATALVNPTKAGYTFDGWFTNSACTGSAITSLDATAYTADITLYAKWTLNTHAVTVASNNTDYGTVDVTSIPNVPHGAAVSVSGNKITINGTTATATATSSDAQYTYAFDNWEAPATITEAATITANFSRTTNTYTVTWKDEDGTTLETDENVPYGTTPTYDGATPTKANDDNYAYTFNGWNPSVDAIVGNTKYTATYSKTPLSLVVSTDKEIAENIELSTVTITTTGELNIKGGATLTATNLILEASTDVSGELAGNVVAENVYFDLKLNTAARHWHAFGVPWNVDVTEHALMEVDADGNVIRTLVVGRDCEIVYYNGATRAAQGPGSHCWEYLKHYSEAGQPIEVMKPGKGYMIAFTSAVQTVRFTKADGADIFFAGTNSVVGGEGENGGWNALANPMAYHATLSAGPTVGYVHDGGEIGHDGYTPYNIDAKKYIVGKMVYVQAASDQTIVVNPAGDAGDMTTLAFAPKRRAKATDKQYLSLNDYYAVSLSNGDKASKVYVLPEEDKADEYVIGHDLSQFSMNATKPQIWVNRYDTKLALNTTALIANVAEFSVSLYAPAAGEYTICNAFLPDEDYTVYLTQDGEAIWNLSDAPYAITLNKGTAKGYGIRLSRKAPQITTGIDEAVVDAKGDTRKVVINDKVFIIRGEHVYSADGQLVK